MEISNVSKISDYIPFSRMEISNIMKFSYYIPFQRMEIHEVYSRKDYER